VTLLVKARDGNAADVKNANAKMLDEMLDIKK
jgi:hypothetical protein